MKRKITMVTNHKKYIVKSDIQMGLLRALIEILIFMGRRW